MNGPPGWPLALLAWGLAALLLAPAAGSVRPPRRQRAHRPAGRRALDPASLARPAAVTGGAALAIASHPLVGLAVGILLWWLLPALVGRMETKQGAADREALAAQLPMTAGLLSACLSAGAPPADALAITADAMAAPANDVLRRAARTVALGGGPAELAQALAAAGEAGWQSMAAAVVRSSITGAPLADLLHDQADTALQSWAAGAAVRARSVAVRSVLPLAICYLPAFLLLGVAPMVAGFFSGLDLP